jgi:methionine-rich copper-binding protein CopC
MRFIMPKLPITQLVVALSLVIPATGAHAHAQLQKAMPAVGGTVTTSPTEIRLKFSEGIEPRFSEITLKQNGTNEPLGNVSVDTSDNSLLIAKVERVLKPGVYTVSWRVVSIDTHRTQGNFAFTVAP